MTGGSTEKEGPHDKQCPKCGLWYYGAGNALKFHMEKCPGEPRDNRSDDSEKLEDTNENETVENNESGGQTQNPTFGGADPEPPEEIGTELPCGCDTVDETSLSPGTYQCDDCGAYYQIT